MDNNNFENDIFNELDARLKDFDASDFRFYNIAHIPIIAQKLNAYAVSCSVCREHKSELRQIVQSLPVCLNESLKSRKDFEKKKYKIEKHLRKVHKTRFPGYYVGLCSFFAILVGVLGAIIINLLTANTLVNMRFFVIIGVTLLVGWFVGNRLDKQTFIKKMQL